VYLDNGEGLEEEVSAIMGGEPRGLQQQSTVPGQCPRLLNAFASKESPTCLGAMRSIQYEIIGYHAIVTIGPVIDSLQRRAVSRCKCTIQSCMVETKAGR
jgi:hypothetical protein